MVRVPTYGELLRTVADLMKENKADSSSSWASSAWHQPSTLIKRSYRNYRDIRREKCGRPACSLMGRKFGFEARVPQISAPFAQGTPLNPIRGCTCGTRMSRPSSPCTSPSPPTTSSNARGRMRGRDGRRERERMIRIDVTASRSRHSLVSCDIHSLGHGRTAG